MKLSDFNKVEDLAFRRAILCEYKKAIDDLPSNMRYFCFSAGYYPDNQKIVALGEGLSASGGIAGRIALAMMRAGLEAANKEIADLDCELHKLGADPDVATPVSKFETQGVEVPSGLANSGGSGGQ